MLLYEFAIIAEGKHLCYRVLFEIPRRFTRSE